MSELAATALRYADILKFRIHPLRPRSKIPATPNGLKDATDNPDIIRQWWTATPDANISVATGAASGVWVLDIDGSDGAAALTTLIAEHGALPVTPEQTTRNGRHIFFKHPGGDTIIRNRTNIIKTPGGNGGIDVRGDGGYVVIAPSQHPDGGHYQWSVSPSKIPFAHAPDWLINLVLKKDAPSGQGAIPQTAPERQTTPTNDLWNDYGSPYRFAENIVHDQLNAVRAAFEGSRNHTLNIAALKLGKLIPCGAVSYPQAHDWLIHAAIACGLPRAEAEATIKSGLHAGLADPYTPRPVNRHDSQTRQSPSPATPPLKKNDLTYDAETGEVLHMPPEQGTHAALPATGHTVYATSLHGIDIPPREWIVDQWILKDCVAALYGDGGVGKSLAAMQLMTCVALGRPFLGIDTMQLKAFGFFCEDTEAELHRRQNDINQHYGIDFNQLDGLMWQSRVGFDNTLMEFLREGKGSPTQAYAILREEVMRTGAQMVVIDTAADTFGGNENVRPQVRQFINHLSGLALEIQGGIVLCAHPSAAGLAKGDGTGGSTAWNNTVRSRMYLSYPKKSDGEELPESDSHNLRVLSKMKANYAVKGDLSSVITLKWVNGAFKVEDGPAMDYVSKIERGNRDKADEALFLSLLDQIAAQGRSVSESPSSYANYAPKIMAVMTGAKGVSMLRITAAMRRLFEAGIIRRGITGTAINRHKKEGIIRC